MTKRRRPKTGTPAAGVITDPVRIANEIALSSAELEFARAVVAERNANGLADVIGYPTSLSGSLRTREPVSSVNTVFHNLRNYLISNLRQVLSEAFVEIGLINTVV